MASPTRINCKSWQKVGNKQRLIPETKRMQGEPNVGNWLLLVSRNCHTGIVIPPWFPAFFSSKQTLICYSQITICLLMKPPLVCVSMSIIPSKTAIFWIPHDTTTYVCWLDHITTILDLSYYHYPLYYLYEILDLSLITINYHILPLLSSILPLSSILY
jgi:hypothetical protein